MDSAAVIAALDAHPYVRSRTDAHGITSYTFTRKAFYEGRWDEFTTRARGLFVRDGRVVGRGFDKFFALGQSLAPTLEDLAYPVTVTRKLNGFLALAFVDSGQLCVYSKSGDTDYGAAALDALRAQLRPHNQESGLARWRAARTEQRLAGWLADHNVSIALEATLPDDPHLVDETGHEALTVLAVIGNGFDFRRRDDLLGHLSFDTGLPVVPCVGIAHDLHELEALLDHDRQAAPGTEGVVLTDASGRMLKVKYDAYLARKRLRRHLERLWRGKSVALPEEYTGLAAALGDDPVAVLESFAVDRPGGGRALDIPRLLRRLDVEGL